MKHVTPPRPFSGSVRANTRPKCARSAPEMKIFDPLMIQSSPSRTARVRIARAGSLPPDGSVRPKKPRFSPRSIGSQITRLLVVVGFEQLREAGAAEHAITRRVQPGAMLRHLDRDQRPREQIDLGAAVLGRNVEPIKTHLLDFRHEPASDRRPAIRPRRDRVRVRAARFPRARTVAPSQRSGPAPRSTSDPCCGPRHTRSTRRQSAETRHRRVVPRQRRRDPPDAPSAVRGGACDTRWLLRNGTRSRRGSRRACRVPRCAGRTGVRASARPMKITRPVASANSNMPNCPGSASSAAASIVIHGLVQRICMFSPPPDYKAAATSAIRGRASAARSSVLSFAVTG